MALACILTCYTTGKKLVNPWIAYLVALLLGPLTGTASFWVIGLLTLGDSSIPAGFIARGTGLSFWTGFVLGPAAVYIARQRTRNASTLPSMSRVGASAGRARPSVGSVPMAPRRSPTSDRNEMDYAAIIRSYSSLLAQGHQSRSQQLLQKLTDQPSQFASQAASLDQFWLLGGRSTSELPFAKNDIEAAIRAAIEASRNPIDDNFLAAALMALADFQDLRWCKTNNVDPAFLIELDNNRFAEYLRELRGHR